MAKFQRTGTAWEGVGHISSQHDDVLQKISEGVIDSVSIGYTVESFETIKAGRSKTIGGREFTAGDSDLRVVGAFSIHEVSLVAVPADAAARIRSA